MVIILQFSVSRNDARSQSYRCLVLVTLPTFRDARNRSLRDSHKEKATQGYPRTQWLRVTANHLYSVSILAFPLQLSALPTSNTRIPTFEYSLFRKLYWGIKIWISSFESEFIRIVRCVVNTPSRLDTNFSENLWSEITRAQKKNINTKVHGAINMIRAKKAKISRNNFHKNRRN